MSTLVLLMASALLLTACSSSTPSSKAKSSAKKAVTVSVWSWTPVSSTMQLMAAKFEAKHPGITISYKIEPHTAYFTSLAAAAASGTMPDLIGLSPGAKTQEYRPDLETIDSVASKLWGPNWKSDFPPALIKEGLFGNPAGNSNLYIVPQEAETIGIWYNTSIFSQLHLTPPTTLAQLESDVSAINHAGYIGFYQGGGTGLFDEWVYMQIAAQTDLKGLLAAETGHNTWNQPGMIQAADAWKTLSQHVFQSGAMAALQYPTGADLFAAGRVGMMSLGSWWLQEVKLPGAPTPAKNMDFSYFNFPAVQSSGKPSPVLGGIDFGWGITKAAAKNPKLLSATEAVLKSFVSGTGEIQAVNTLNDLPAFKGIVPTATFSSHVMSLFTRLKTAVTSAYPHAIGPTSEYNALVANLQDVATGKKTPSAAMAAVGAATS
ncbi:MAG: ABC transporter substrate-binding protein [Acidimicrobiales bacterium]